MPPVPAHLSPDNTVLKYARLAHESITDILGFII